MKLTTILNESVILGLASSSYYFLGTSILYSININITPLYKTCIGLYGTLIGCIYVCTWPPLLK